MQITVRYFAGAAQAAATTSESVEISPGTTLEQLLAQLSQRTDELARELAASSYLINSRPVTDRSSVLEEGINLDVLPPFAGGGAARWAERRVSLSALPLRSSGSTPLTEQLRTVRGCSGAVAPLLATVAVGL